MSQSTPTDAEVNIYASYYVLHGDQSSAFRTTFPNSKANKEVINSKASTFHAMGKVKERVIELSEKARVIAEKEFEIDSKYVLRRLKEIDELDIIDILNDDLKSFKSLKEWPKVWRQNIDGIDLMTMTKDGEDFESVLRKIKWPNKTKNLELLGKHTSVQAFSENVNIKAKVKFDKSFNDFYDE